MFTLRLSMLLSHMESRTDFTFKKFLMRIKFKQKIYFSLIIPSITTHSIHYHPLPLVSPSITTHYHWFPHPLPLITIGYPLITTHYHQFHLLVVTFWGSTKNSFFGFFFNTHPICLNFCPCLPYKDRYLLTTCIIIEKLKLMTLLSQNDQIDVFYRPAWNFLFSLTKF